MYARFKGLYRGYGIYWHGPIDGYGDETNGWTRTIAEYRAKIDRMIAKAEAARPDHEKYWDTLTSEQRRHWRLLSQTTELSASELAYTNRKVTAMATKRNRNQPQSPVCQGDATVGPAGVEMPAEFPPPIKPNLTCPNCANRTLRLIEVTEPTVDDEYKEVRTCDTEGCDTLVYIVKRLN